MRVLVTGAAGYIGSALVKALKESALDVEVRATDWKEGEGIVVGDLRDLAFVRRELVDWDPEVVFHLAAVSSEAEARKAGWRYTQEANSWVTRTLDLWLKERAVLVFASTAMVPAWTFNSLYAQSKERAEEHLGASPGREERTRLVYRLGTVVGRSPVMRWTVGNELCRRVAKGEALEVTRDTWRPFVALSTVLGEFLHVVDLVVTGAPLRSATTYLVDDNLSLKDFLYPLVDEDCVRVVESPEGTVSFTAPTGAGGPWSLSCACGELIKEVRREAL